MALSEDATAITAAILTQTHTDWQCRSGKAATPDADQLLSTFRHFVERLGEDAPTAHDVDPPSD